MDGGPSGETPAAQARIGVGDQGERRNLSSSLDLSARFSTHKVGQAAQGVGLAVV